MPFVEWQDSAGDLFVIDPLDESSGINTFFPTPGNYASQLLSIDCASSIDRSTPCFELGAGGFIPGNAFGGVLTVTATATPEPGALFLTLLGIGLFGFFAARFRDFAEFIYQR